MFKVRPFESRTTSWWYLEKENLDLAPQFQRRGNVWSSYDKAFLVDSILNDYDMPKIYIADFSYVSTKLNTANKAYAVIDGRQRFEAIFDFFQDKFALDKNFRFNEEPKLELKGLKYSELNSKHPRVATKFSNFNLSVMSVITDDNDRISELFVRLNRGRPLLGAEIRNAMKGRVPDAIRALREHAFFRKFVTFPRSRQQDGNVAAKILLTEFGGRFVDTKKSSIDDFVLVAELSESTTSVDDTLRKSQEVLTRMTEVFVENDRLLRAQNNVLIFYWLVRQHPDDSAKALRDFISKFEAERTVKGGPVSKDLVRYTALFANTNNASSLVQRFEIIERLYASAVSNSQEVDSSRSTT